MCRIFSGYATRSGDTTGEIYCIPDKTHSHSVIAAVFNLRDSDVSFYAQNLCKYEYIPPEDTKLWGDLSKWKLCIDEPGGEAPDWFDREKVIAHMERLVRQMFVTDERNWLVGGCWIFDGEKSMCKGVLGGMIVGAINGANLDGANLHGANLTRANLDGASLTRANLAGANLDGASLDGASLTRANLDGANLTGASLDGANLTGANLTRAYLAGAS
ncbi:MAG: pentapeptide repeat-containing protein, partial [Armatimonadia bacterium]